jgi:site-specific recombinase XerD
LTFEDFDAARVRQFLDWLEASRQCKARTRNQRLAAIKAFFGYVASRAPEHLDRCRQIRDIAAKRIKHEAVRYLEESDMQAILKGIDPSSPDALRDSALLTLMYNTGARVSEIVDLDVVKLRLGAPPMVRLMGKGRKERDVPLWSQTVALLRQWLQLRGLPEDAKVPLFVNARGVRLTRSGITYILKRAVGHADLPPESTRPKSITPHVVRHTTAMHLLTSGVDITVISSWLGHSQLSTTHTYVEITNRMKQAAIAAATNILPESITTPYPPPALIEWLDALGRGQRYVERSHSGL